MLKFIKVTGESLFPEYKGGDYVMVFTDPFFPFKEGDTIVFRHPVHGLMIKNIKQVESDKILVEGLHPNSIDSRQFGPLDRRIIIGKVIWHIKRPET